MPLSTLFSYNNKRMAAHLQHSYTHSPLLLLLSNHQCQGQGHFSRTDNEVINSLKISAIKR